MIPFTFNEILYAIFLFSIIGILMGGGYTVLKKFLSSFPYVTEIFCKAIASNKVISPKRETKINLDENRKQKKAHNQTFDFLFFTFSGIIYIIMSYICLDGGIRLYTALIYSAFFVASSLMFEKISIYFIKPALFIVKICAFIFSVASLPLSLFRKIMCLLFTTIRERINQINFSENRFLFKKVKKTKIERKKY